MGVYFWPLVIFVTFGVLLIGAGFLMARDPAPEDRVDRLADPAPMPGELLWCQRCGSRHPALYGCPASSYGPFPADTGPLLIPGRVAAAGDDLEREVARLIREAERKIGRLQP